MTEQAASQTKSHQPGWRCLGDVEIVVGEEEVAHGSVRDALNSSLAPLTSNQELSASMESALIEAIERKRLSIGIPESAAESIDPPCCRLIISCLSSPQALDEQVITRLGWSFFVIERPASPIEIIEICLYQE